MWSRTHKTCVVCGKRSSPHMAKGRCKKCYLKAYRETDENADRIREQKSAWYWKHHAENLRKRKIYREKVNFSGNRQAAIDAVDGVCNRCGKKRPLTVHHKDRSGRGAKKHNNAVENLEALCRGCHIREHGENQYRGGTRKLSRWSRAHDCCRLCKTTDVRHASHGLCRTCLARERRKKMT